MTEGQNASSKSSGNQKLSSLLKILLVFLFFALIPLLTITIITYITSRNISTSVTHKNLEVVATLEKEAIENWLGGINSDISTLAAVPAFEQMDAKGAQEFISRYMEQQKDYENIFFAGVDGITIAASDDPGRNLSERESFKEALAGKTVLSQPVLSKASGHILIVAAAPVMKDGQVMGVIGITAPLAHLNPLLSSAWIGSTGEAYIIDSKGILLTPSRFTDYLRENGYIINQSELELKVNTYAFDQIAAGQNGSAEYSNYIAKRVIGAYQYIPEMDWGGDCGTNCSRSAAAL